MSNLYEERDIIEQGDHYSRHVSAMTSEGLHSKSAIAAELAHRDIETERLRAKVAELESTPESYEAMKRMHRLENYPNELAARGWLLRKQAEAVEHEARLIRDAAQSDLKRKLTMNAVAKVLTDNAQRLRQQADEAERAGGEK